MMADPMAAALRQAGVPDSVARMAGVPSVPGMQGIDNRPGGMVGMPGLNALDAIPEMRALAVAGVKAPVHKRAIGVSAKSIQFDTGLPEAATALV